MGIFRDRDLAGKGSEMGQIRVFMGSRHMGPWDGDPRMGQRALATDIQDMGSPGDRGMPGGVPKGVQIRPFWGHI